MGSILIIDDEEDIRDALQMVLESAGHNVKVASNGDDAIELQSGDPVDLLLTDIIMPGKDGVDTIKEIRQEFPGIRIIAISGGGAVQPTEYVPEAIKTTAYLAALSNMGAFENDRFDVECEAGVCPRKDGQEAGVTLLVSFHPLGCKEPVSFTLHQTVSGCRVTTTAFAPVMENCA